MSILNEELEERYPIEEGDCITLTREQLALQLRRAYKAGATRDYKRTPHGHTELVEIIRLRRNTPCFSYGDIRRLCLTSPYASL